MLSVMEPYIFDLPNVGSADIGRLTILERHHLPFIVKRVYWTVDVPSEKIRGHHAHHELEQIIVAMHGSLELIIEKPDRSKTTFLLSNPHQALYIPKLCWREIKFSPHAVLMCLASLEYSEADYIRSYYDFVKLTEQNAAGTKSPQV